MRTATWYARAQASVQSSPLLGWEERCFWRTGEIKMAAADICLGAQSAVSELDVLWITAGLGCDGDTIATLFRNL